MEQRRRKIGIAFSVAVFLLSACSSSQRQNEFSKEIAPPVKTKTSATNALGCFGDMLTAYRRMGSNVNPLRLAVISAKDATDVSTVTYPNSEIPSDFKDMTLGLISRIGGPIRVVHVPSANELFDAARYGSIVGKKSPFLDSFQVSHYRGDTLQIYGALTEYDRLVSGKDSSVDGSVEFGKGRGITNVEASASGITNVARMTMDFRVVYAAVGDVVNNTSSTNTVTVYQRGRDRSFGLSIDGNTIGYSVSRSVVDARHKAIRLLIEWGLIETLGRYALVPYWKCLPNSKNQKLISFKDLVSNNKLYDFQNFNRNKRQPARRKSKLGLIDMRDQLLMNSVLSDFANAEYLKNKTRRLVKRGEKDTSLVQRKTITVPDPNATKEEKDKTIEKVVETKSLIEGKSTLRRNVLTLYKRNAKYAKLSDAVLLKRLHNEFVKAKILNAKDKVNGSHMYLALWLNAPVQQNGRWRK
ncbi:MAG: hypothetical protein L3J51_02225 [Cocleimonas sp.]|nr:hypothetical protein [Cocleimonas sp.]